MSIVNSVFAQDGPVQRDGTIWIKETHTDNAGAIYLFQYRALDTTNANAVLTERAAQIAEQIAQAEFVQAVQVDAMPTLVYNTAAQFIARFRAAYRDATDRIAAALAWWMIQRINAGDITNQQCANAFGLTLAQWTTLSTNRLTPQHDAWAAMLSAQGA